MVLCPLWKRYKKVIVELGVTSIGGNAFNNCTSLVEVTLPNSIDIIGYYAFYYCISLTDIDIPESVSVINDFLNPPAMLGRTE